MAFDILINKDLVRRILAGLLERVNELESGIIPLLEKEGWLRH